MTAFDPRTHQRDRPSPGRAPGEKEHLPPQEDRGQGPTEALEARSRAKAAKNNKGRHDQTGRALAAAREQAKRSGAE